MKNEILGLFVKDEYKTKKKDEEGEESDGLPEMEKDLKKIITECCVEGKMNCFSELDYFRFCLNRNVQVSQIKLKCYLDNLSVNFNTCWPKCKIYLIGNDEECKECVGAKDCANIYDLCKDVEEPKKKKKKKKKGKKKKTAKETK